MYDSLATRRQVKIDMRWRVFAFLAVLLADAALVRKQPWPVVIGCAAYLVIVFPALKR
jgi:hypothetical protein